MIGCLFLVPTVYLCYKPHPIPLCSLLYQNLLRKEFGISDLNLNVVMCQTCFLSQAYVHLHSSNKGMKGTVDY